MIKARVLLSRSKRKKIVSTIGLYSTAFVDNTAPPQLVEIISEKSRFYFRSAEFPPVTYREVARCNLTKKCAA